LGFNNGVLDLTTKTFREGNEYDYISFTTGYDFSEPDAEKLEKLRKIIWEINSEDENKNKTFLKVLARAMCGDNTQTNQRFYCWYGSTARNGKSTTMTLIEKAFGEYFHQPHSTLITQASARSDSANGDLASLVGKRFAFMSEMEKDAKPNVATIKNMTGENKFTYRNLHEKKQKTTLITYTPFLLTNDKLNLDCDDHGILRRLVYFSFKSKFVDREEELVKENADGLKYYLAECLDDNTLEGMRNEFVHLLLEHYNHKERIDFTGDIKKETDDIINSQDQLKEMLNNTFQKAENPQYGVSWEDFKKIMKERNGVAWETIRKNLKTDANLIEKVKVRIPHAKMVGVACGSSNPYFTKDNRGAKARRVFMGIVERDEDYSDF
jgi:phage/plasmid-associated DNA primase